LRYIMTWADTTRSGALWSVAQTVVCDTWMATVGMTRRRLWTP
jgi:hypothetical protein